MLSPESLAVIAGWLVLITRFGTAYRSGSLQAAEDRNLVLRMWSTLLFIVLAGTFHHPQMRRVVVEVIGPWAAFFPSTASSIIAYLLACSVCFHLAPSQRPRYPWHLVSGIAVIFAVTWLKPGLPPDERMASVGHAYGDLIFTVYVAIVAWKLVLPSLTYSIARESNPIMSLRLRVMRWTHWIVILWMMNSLLGAVATIALLPYDTQPVYIFSIFGFLITFLLAYLMPERVFVWMLDGLRHVANVCELAILKLLHRRAFARIEWQAKRIPALTSILRPELSIYTTVIDLFDALLALRELPPPEGRNIRSRIAAAAHPELSYKRVRDRLIEGLPGASLLNQFRRATGLDQVS